MPTSSIVTRAAQRRIVFVPFEDVAEIADAGGRQRLDRPGRDRVDADALLAEIFGHIAHARFERGFGDAHDVVVRHDFLGAVIGERQHAAAVRHHLLGALRDRGERVAGDVHRHREIVRRRVDVAALELLLVGERDGVDDEIERCPISAASSAKAASSEPCSDTSQSIRAAGLSGATSGVTRFLKVSP